MLRKKEFNEGVSGGTNLEFTKLENECPSDGEVIKNKLNSLYGKDAIENKSNPLYRWIKWINK